MLTKILLAGALLLAHLGIAQEKEKFVLTVSGPSRATLSLNGAQKTSPIVANIKGKGARITLDIPASLADKVTIKVIPEAGASASQVVIFPPTTNKVANISATGVLSPEGIGSADAPIGSKITIVAALKSGGESLVPINTWEIATGFAPLGNTPAAGPRMAASASATDTTGTGIPYYDAMTLQNTMSTKVALKILGYYAGQDLNEDQLAEVFKDNPYILDYWKNKKLSPGFQVSAASVSKLASSAISAVGGLDVTNIAHGFAKFLVKRTKQELNITFFTRFKDELSKEKYRDLRSVFPQTWRALNAIGDEIYNYQIYIQTLRECFEKDLANILANLPEVIDNHPEFFKTQPELEAILRSGFYIAQALQDKQHPGKIIANYPEQYLHNVDANFLASMRTLKIVSNAFRYRDETLEEGEGQRYWLNEKEVALLFKRENRPVLLIFMGLLQEEARRNNVVFGSATKPVTLASIIKEAHPTLAVDLPQYEQYFKTLATKIQVVDKKIAGLKGVENDSLLLENYYSFFASTLDVLKYTAEAEDLPHFKELLPNVNLKATAKPYFEVAQTTSDIVIDVNRRNYGSAVTNAYSLWNLIFGDNREKKIQKMETARAAATPAATKAALSNDIATLQDGDNLMSLFYKYGTFMSTIVQAQSADEVEAAIEAFALPPGSSRIKRETSFNVSLNAYTGLFAGYERVKGVDTKFKVNSFGVTAPIGVAISKGKTRFLRWDEKGHWSYSLFISLIDLGAVASYRFTTDTGVDSLSAQQVPTIELRDILSPGAFLSVGIPKTPLSVNIGWQVGPNLRKIENNQDGTISNAYENATYGRFSAAIVVDIPLMNFYTRTPAHANR